MVQDSDLRKINEAKMIIKAIKIIVPSILLAALAAGVIPGCSREDQALDKSNNIRATAKMIPPIDAAAPLKIETATFALG
jgi:hypothetical protein